MPTPKLISSISKVNTTTTTTTPAITDNVSNEGIILKEVVATDDGDINSAKFQSSSEVVPILTTTTTAAAAAAPEIILEEEVNSNKIRTDSVSNKEAISNLDIVTVADNGIDNAKFQSITVPIPVPIKISSTTTTELVIRTENVLKEKGRIILSEDDILGNLTGMDNSKEDGKVSEDINSNLNLNLDVVNVDYTFWKEESNSPTMLTNSNPTYRINILTDGEILSLPLFRSIYRVEQFEKVEDDILFHDSPKAIADFPTHKVNSSPGIWDDVDSIVPNYENNEGNNSFIIEEKCSIGFVPGQPDNLFIFPSGDDVLDDSLLHNNHGSVDNEDNAENHVAPDMIHGEICDRSENVIFPPPPTEHPPRPSIMLHDGINNESIVLHGGNNNLIGEYETICNKHYDKHYGGISKSNDVDHIPPRSHQEDEGKYPIRKLNDDDILNVESGTSVGRDYGDNDDTYNDTIPNQADNNRPNDGESKIILLHSSEHLICSQIEGSIRRINTNDTVLEIVKQYRRLNTLICEVNEEYSFWCPH